MGRSAASVWLLSALGLVVGLALAACASGSKEPEPPPNVFPPDYKQEIIDTLTRVLDDPTNVREGYISEPVLRPAGKEERYTVCVRFNSRNVMREYSGAKDRIGYFFGGHLNQLIDATKEQCGNAPYKPFPELEKLCLGNKCE
ncbi:MAG TPA: hypothetical protein VII24_07610 [Pseudolabrys sp.]